MVCLGILWNSIQTHANEVLNDIKDYGKILDIFSMNLDVDYEKFVRDIYSQDEIADWKVNKKIETMFQCSDNRKVTVLIIDVETNEKVYHPFKKREVYINLENMKANIRKKYSEVVEYYFFDNIFHVTDDEKEYIADLNVVNSYLEKGIKKDEFEYNQNSKKVLKKEFNNYVK